MQSSQEIMNDSNFPDVNRTITHTHTRAMSDWMQIVPIESSSQAAVSSDDVCVCVDVLFSRAVVAQAVT